MCCVFVSIVTVVVYYGMSPCLNLKQMGLGSIHNFLALEKLMITEGDLSACQVPEPNSSFGLSTGGCDFLFR